MNVLSRRRFLRGATGVALALPWLEAFAPSSARAQSAAPRRFLLAFGGCSLGGEDGSIADTVVPSVVGPQYDLKPAFAGLAAVRDQVSIVSGLQIPTAVNGVVPAGGKPIDFHGFQMPPLLTGTRTLVGEYASPTADQLAGAVLGDTPFGPLVVRVQASSYIGSAALGSGDAISFRQGLHGLEPIIPRVSPQALFLALFGGFTAPGITPAQAAHQNWLLDRRLSLLDSVARSVSRVERGLGQADRVRLDQHLEQVRELEQRVRSLDRAEAGACQVPADPGIDPPIGASQVQGSNGSLTFQPDRGYSGEEQRAGLICELIAMALTCDLTRSVLLQFTAQQSFMSMVPLSGQQSDLHGLSHGSYGHQTEANATLAMAPGVAWHVRHFGALLQRLAGTPEAGGTLLDHTASVLTFEGGQGYDPASGLTVSPHSTQNMVCLAAGGGLAGGQHFVATGLHPASVMLTALKSVGYASSALGEVQTEIAGLRP